MKDNGIDIAQLRTGARASALAAWLLLVAAGAGYPAEVRVRVTDAGGTALAGAVVALQPAAGAGVASGPGEAIMAQQRQEFVPGVLAIRRGDRVRFPNHDDTQHHVYSFSPAKVFELPLYKGDTPAPIEFDQAGVVALGCNIHDHMRGFIFVADTPHFATTSDAGEVVLADVPAAAYRLLVWHPRAVEPPPPESVDVTAEGLELSRAFAVRPPPRPVVKGLRAWTSQ